MNYDKSAVIPRRIGRGLLHPFMARSPRGGAAAFDLYDSLLFVGKPDLSPYGFKRARTVYEAELWPAQALRNAERGCCSIQGRCSVG